MRRDFLAGVMLAAATVGLSDFQGGALLAQESTATGATTESSAKIQVEPGEQTENFFAIPEPAEGRPNRLPFLLYTPKDYEAGQHVPLLLFLHGLGESGDGNFQQIAVHGPPKRVGKEGKEMPFVIVSPQSPKPGKDRKEVVESWRTDELMALLDHVEGQLSIDTRRVYVSGLSMGGFGTWRLAATHPERFAAAIPICGGGKTEWADKLAKIPLWVFHGGQDTVVELHESEEMVTAIQRAGGDVKLTIYPDAGHDSWTATYANPEVYAWLLRHQLDQSSRAF
ncbi:alpha/beta fold hydrolase [Rhodopirellula sp. P2]|uniref:carboxylesterase family protein n=1 Tax=Rhodopirellula sp. P2 TaxID=2127060 RepID=UPI002368E4D5|nr:alpha/beta fold hydrolase [Rhodopirellula sp. P2]WDQ17820.1 prolyl oligopeptidase family serine peptidase [Rhodopirellula sp. P2]